MAVPAEKTMNDALMLPSNLRATLADKLLESLNSPSQKKLDALWAKEAEKRLKDIRGGKVKPIPGNVVFEEIRQRYGQ